MYLLSCRDSLPLRTQFTLEVQRWPCACSWTVILLCDIMLCWSAVYCCVCRPLPPWQHACSLHTILQLSFEMAALPYTLACCSYRVETTIKHSLEPYLKLEERPQAPAKGGGSKLSQECRLFGLCCPAVKGHWQQQSIAVSDPAQGQSVP